MRTEKNLGPGLTAIFWHLCPNKVQTDGQMQFLAPSLLKGLNGSKEVQYWLLEISFGDPFIDLI